jgi:hypothetical protein
MREQWGSTFNQRAPEKFKESIASFFIGNTKMQNKRRTVVKSDTAILPLSKYEI